MERTSIRGRTRQLLLWVGFIVSMVYAGLAWSQHAPIIFYNVPNWYSSGWSQIRYDTPDDAYAVEWWSHNRACTSASGKQEEFSSTVVAHLDGYEDGDLYSARVIQRNCADGSAIETGYPSGARRWAMCPGSDWGPYNVDAWGGHCPVMSPNLGKNQGAPACPICKAGDPINPALGNKYDVLTLVSGSGSFPASFVVTYNNVRDPYLLSSSNLALGHRRVHNYQMRVVIASGGPVTTAYVLRPDGKLYAFDQAGTKWVGDADVADTLESVSDGVGAVASWIYARSDNTRELYDAAGRLQAIVRQDGQRQNLSYDANGHLQSVTDPQGRSIVFTSDEKGRIAGVQSADGANYQLTYDGNSNLVEVGYPDSSNWTYVYGEPNASGVYPGVNDMTGQVDELGKRVDTTTYLQNDTVVTDVGAEGANPASFDGLPGWQNLPSYSYTDHGVKHVVNINYMFGVPKPTSVTRTCANCVTQTEAYTYDVNGRMATHTDANKHVTTTTFDGGGLLTATTEAKGTTEQRTTLTTWDSGLRAPLVQTIQDASAKVLSRTGWAYNAGGKTIASCSIDPGTASSYTCSPDGTAPAGVRRTVMTYCTAVDTTSCPLVGLLLKTDGPRTDVADTVSYAYYLTTDESGCATQGGACYHLGDLQSTINGAGLVTTYVSYDKAGRLTRIKDPNGVLTDYTYTPRGWLASTTIRANTSGVPSASDAVTTVTYDPTGTVHSVQDPDGVTTTYTYDAAHRLTDITDALGSRIHYTLDAAGNRTAEQVLSASGAVVRSLGRTYNALGQLTAITDGLNRTVFSAGFTDSYDGNGNLVHTQDALSVQQKQVYDGLNRLVSTLRDYQGTNAATANAQSVTSFDALDRVTGFSDPDGLNTTYDFDGLGNATGLHSPDTGTTTRGFDISGNPVSSVDAANVATNSTYDALNRLTGTTYADTSLNVAYHYDEADAVTGCTGNFGEGRLTRVVEGSGGLVYCYDAHGNVVRKQQTVGTSSRTTTYTWSAANRLQSVTTPNGTRIAYARNSLGQTTSIQATANGPTTIVVGQAVYQPFGPLASYTLGDGQTVTRSFDATGALTDIASAAFSLHVKRDAMGNVVALGDTAGAVSPTETYTYDSLYRLTGLTTANAANNEAYTYNKTGDRLSKVAPGLLTGTYNYASGTHHLTGVGSTTRVVDARGNTTMDVLAAGTYGYGYNGRNRLTVVQNGGVTVAGYVLNALGQRVQKTVGGSTTWFDYDEGSQLLSESVGTTARDYVWMDGMPVGIVDHTGSAATFSFVHADGLGSPRAVTDATGSVLWEWAYANNAFGEKAPVSSVGYSLNFRYPGQYFDAESGLNYNVNRDYQAATGRYIQSDPIGLDGGMNTYGYVSEDPLGSIDPLGLCEDDRCKKVKEDALEECSDTSLPTFNYGFRFWNCVNAYVAAHGCGPGGKPIPNPDESPAVAPPDDGAQRRAIGWGLGAAALRLLGALLLSSP